jgi:hypothetical protein
LVDEVKMLAARFSAAGGMALGIENVDPPPGIGLVDPGQHLDQGGFTRAVLSDDGQNLAAMKVERDVVKRLGSGEGLRDPTNAE